MARDQVLGRTEELGVISDFLASIPGEAVALIIRGEAGIGKTTLWSEALAIARQRDDTTVLMARAVESESGLAYVTLTDLLGPRADSGPPDLPAPQRAALAAAMLRDATPAEPPDPRTIGTAVLGTLRQTADDGPLVVLVDDVQWIDPASAAALAFAFRRLDDAPVATVLTVRTAPDIAPSPLVSALHDGGHTIDLDVGPVTLGILHHLIEDRVGTTLTRPQLTRLEEASGGNPLLAIEIARELARRERWPLPGEPMPVPSSAAELLEERIGRMPPGDREVLFMVAAMAVPTVAQLHVAAEVGDADATLDRARTEGLIEIDAQGRVRFEHPLMASAALLAVPPNRQRSLHARLAEIATTAEDRGRHLALSVEGPDADGAHALDEAAIAARSRGATAVAAAWAERAAAMTPHSDPSAWTARITRSARWFGESGEIGRARSLLSSAVKDMAPGDGRAAAMLVLAQIVSWDDGAEVGRRLSEAGLADAVDPGLRARLLLRIAFDSDATGMPRALEAASAAVTELEAATTDVDPDLLACALLQRAYLRFGAGITTDEPAAARGIALLGPQPRRTPDGDEAPESLRAHAMVWERAVDLDDLANGLAHQVAEFERDIARGLERVLPLHAAEIAMTELWLGAWADAAAHADRAMVLAAQTGATTQGRSAAITARAFVDAYRGDLDAAEAGARRGLELSAEAGDWLKARDVAILGLIALSRGDAAAAAALLGSLYDDLQASGAHEMLGNRFVGDLLDAAVAAGDLARARVVVDRLDSAVASVPRPWVLTMAARGHALIAAADGDLDGAAARIDVALAHGTTLPMPFEVARTELIAGRIARRRKERRRAAAFLERAREAFVELGAARWVEIADAELARTGRRAIDSDALTETEDRVARLAASGMTNRQVGEAAFLTPKSVEGVLARVYGKLGIRSRAELGAWLAAQAADRDGA